MPQLKKYITKRKSIISAISYLYHLKVRIKVMLESFTYGLAVNQVRVNELRI